MSFRIAVCGCVLTCCLGLATAARAGGAWSGDEALSGEDGFGLPSALAGALAEPGTDVRVFSRPLGGVLRPSPGLHVAPYFELATQTPDRGASVMWSMLGAANPSGYVLVGARARLALAPGWHLGADMAAGHPFIQPAFGHLSGVPALAGDDGAIDTDIAWRAGFGLGYQASPRLGILASVQLDTLAAVPVPPMPGPRTGLAAQTTLLAGFRYRFEQ